MRIHSFLPALLFLNIFTGDFTGRGPIEQMTEMWRQQTGYYDSPIQSCYIEGEFYKRCPDLTEEDYSDYGY